MRILILADSQAGTCDGGCGKDWSAPAALAAAQEELEARFHRPFTLEYVDLARDTAASETFRGLPLPALLIDGQPRMSGVFDTRRLLEAVDTELEIRGGN
ncbi:MAG: hypothetical protein HYX96_09130 [Chloroflexi bacterium]|nr:hypothetical protein [Chloroflexota bacterium]